MMKQLLTLVAIFTVLHGEARAEESIKLGLLNVDSGPFISAAARVHDGAALAVELLNAQGGALGRKYELVTQAHSGTPAATAAAAGKLVERGAKIFTGLNSSGMSLAVIPRLAGLDAIFIDATALSDDLTGKNCAANYFRVSVNDGQTMNSLRDLIRQSGVKTWSSLIVDFAAGHDFSKGINALIQVSGGTMQTTLFAPLGTTDFGSYIAQLTAKPSEGLVVYMPGAPGIALARQQNDFALFGRYKKIIAHNSFTNEIVLGAQGDTTLGIYTPQGYNSAFPGELNAAYVQAFETRYKRKPSFLEGDLYLAFSMIHAAIVKAKSTEVSAVRTALAGLKASTLVGEVEMRAADHQLVRPMVMLEVNKGTDGKAEMALKAVLSADKIAPPVSADCRL